MTEHAPLSGVRVIVTRAAHQARELARLLAERGALVVNLPLLEVIPPEDATPLDEALARLGDFRWVAVTSPNAVDAVFSRLPDPWPARTRAAAIGPATAEALGKRGVQAAVVAEVFRAEGLVEGLRTHLEPGEQVLLPQAADARSTLADGLEAAGFRPLVVEAYRKRLPAEAPARMQQLFQGSPLGWVSFTSPSTVRHFVQVLDADWEPRRPELRGASIGPVTSEELRRQGIEPAAEAAAPTDIALVEAIVRAFMGPPQKVLTES